MMEHATLLIAPMNKLGLGTRFNSHFFYPKRDIMKQEEVLTLGEFLKLNTQPLVGKESFIVWKSEDARKKIWNPDNFTVVSDAFKKLKSFLLENNFDYNDWIMLLPAVEDSQYGSRFKYELLNKKRLNELWLHRIARIKVNGIPYRNLWWIINPDGDYRRDFFKSLVTVGQVLQLDDNFFKQGPPSSVYPITWDTSELKSVPKIQEKLRAYGFSEEDGPFMSLKF